MSFLLGCICGAYLSVCMGVYAMLVPASVTFSIGSMYMFFRQWFKDFFKKLIKERLTQDLENVGTTLCRTHKHLHNLRKSHPQETDVDVPAVGFDDLESEVEHILETMHQVEADIEDLGTHTPHSTPSHTASGHLEANV